MQRDKLLHVDITEDLRDFVSSLTYASFHDYDESAVRDADGPLEPWQVQHATAILKECPELENLRYVLCPKCAPGHVGVADKMVYTAQACMPAWHERFARQSIVSKCLQR